MSKNINLDKFYTPIDIAQKCVDLMLETIKDKINATEYLEPSAGSGNFSNLIPNTIAYDIQPDNDQIIKADFLKLPIKYMKGRVIFGNPPFGNRNNLTRSFFKKSTLISDVIAFVLPVSQLNNIDSLYQFDLVKSIDLGVLEYSGIKVHCCFNIYLRPLNGLNKKPNHKTDEIIVYRDDQPDYDNVKFDFAIVRRGTPPGKLRIENLHTQTYKIYVCNRDKIEEIKKKILDFDWINFKKHQSAPSLSKNDIYRSLK